ncbi:hypothetical protein BJ508DRAFT_73273 [Ascobolus immersus RN42]|uniref:Uncharacterized protein n=1 Tax=Ascobolus immersus RN42 TaxID=1160509 RepID=A0A3N4HE19_ASCIM|nr:hypothetical protein BJ508DRAFT_73273 [Ascobolus immersus RN42]
MTVKNALTKNSITVICCLILLICFSDPSHDVPKSSILCPLRYVFFLANDNPSALATRAILLTEFETSKDEPSQTFPPHKVSRIMSPLL